MKPLYFVILLLFFSQAVTAREQLDISGDKTETAITIRRSFLAIEHIFQLLPVQFNSLLTSLQQNTNITDAGSNMSINSNGGTEAPLLNDNQRSDEQKNSLTAIRSQRNIFITAAIGLLLILLVVIYFYRKTIHLNKIMLLHQSHLEELNSMKDKLLSVIGHDLRGPIARIPAIIDIYEDPNTTPDEKQFILENLKEQTKASLETFDKLLYWGQTLVKGISLHQIEMKPKGYIKEGIDLRKIKATEKNITITDHTPADLLVFSDPSLFDFIIRNLLANALKYTFQNGTIDIYSDTSLLKGFTVFSVKDSGIGIDKENITKLFYSLKSQKGTDNEKGHGIGLMLCKEFAVQNGGDIWVESEKGKGATFYFSVKSHA
jgi:signal transduction histidine kinase